MKKGRINAVVALTSALCFGLITTSLVSCGCERTDDQYKLVVTGGRNGYVGETVQLSCQVYGDSDQSVSWSSSNSEVATVSSEGLVTFVSVGTVQITASKDGSQSSPLTLKVYDRAEGTLKLELTSSPSRLAYKTGEALSFEGLEVTGYSYTDNGIRMNDSGVKIPKESLTFSMAEGTSLTEGTHTINVSYGDFAATSFTVTAGEHIEETRLYVSQYPSKTEYYLGTDNLSDRSFSNNGIRVYQQTFVDGVYQNQSRASNVTYSINNGYEFLNEGSFEISVYSPGCVSTKFTVMVYTEDTTAFDIIKELQDADTKNYQIEVFNNVGTTTDTTGFHYLRTYTEDYYEEIQYQNTINSTTSSVEFTTDQIKTQFGYTSHIGTDGNTTIVAFASSETTGVIEGDVIVAEGSNYSSWWDLSSTLATTPSVFDLEIIPVASMNGRYMVTTIEQVPGDDENGTQTLALYPLAEQFLDYCGWSSSLITIMDRFTITVGNGSLLTMRADFGYYGYTSIVVNTIGGARSNDAEEFVQYELNDSLIQTLKTTVDPDVQDLADLLLQDNYTVVSYDSDVGLSSNAKSYVTDKYYYDPNARFGFYTYNDSIYRFTTTGSGTATRVLTPTLVETELSFKEYVNSLDTSDGQGYLSVGLSNILGGGSGSGNIGSLYTISRFDGFSFGEMITYQSFDRNLIMEFLTYLGEDFSGATEDQIEAAISGYRFWFTTYYTDAVISKDNIYQLEIWAIQFTGSGGSGAVAGFTDIGTTSLGWLETYLEGLSA